MSRRKSFTVEEARPIGEQVGIDWDAAPFELEQFRRGLDVELEHGWHDPSTNVTDDDPVITGEVDDFLEERACHRREVAGGRHAHRRQAQSHPGRTLWPAMNTRAARRRPEPAR